MASPALITKETALEAVITTELKTSEAGLVLGAGSDSATALRLTLEESADACHPMSQARRARTSVGCS